MQRYAYAASIAGFAVESLIVVTTLFAEKPVVPSWVLVPLFLGAVAVVGVTVSVYRRRPADFWRGGPVFYAVGILLWLFAIVSLYELKGAKDPFTHQEQLAQQRVFAAVPAFFYLVGIAAHRGRDG